MRNGCFNYVLRPRTRERMGDVEVSVSVTPNGYADAIYRQKFVMPEVTLRALRQPSLNTHASRAGPVRVGYASVRVGYALVRVGYALVRVGYALVRVGYAPVRVGYAPAEPRRNVA